MFCTKCGNRNTDNTRFCISCGNELQPRSGVIQKQIPEELNDPTISIPILRSTSPEVMQPGKFKHHSATGASGSGRIIRTIICLFALILLGGFGYWYYSHRQETNYFAREYAGSMEGKSVKLNLIRQKYIISATLKYTNGGLPQSNLTGTTDREGNFILYQADKSKAIRGKLLSKKSISGTISMPDGSNSSSFYLTNNNQ